MENATRLIKEATQRGENLEPIKEFIETWFISGLDLDKIESVHEHNGLLFWTYKGDKLYYTILGNQEHKSETIEGMKKILFTWG